MVTELWALTHDLCLIESTQTASEQFDSTIFRRIWSCSRLIRRATTRKPKTKLALKLWTKPSACLSPSSFTLRDARHVCCSCPDGLALVSSQTYVEQDDEGYLNSVPPGVKSVKSVLLRHTFFCTGKLRRKKTWVRIGKGLEFVSFIGEIGKFLALHLSWSWVSAVLWAEDTVIRISVC